MTRGKRLLSLLLSVLMLCTLLPPRASAAPTLYFTAVNDRMCDLSDETMPFWQNGLLYVAGATVDGPDDLGIRYSYNQEKSVAILYKGQRVLYCDLTAGTMENNRTGEQYAGSPIVRSGMVFFPITALAKMFDLKYSSTKIAYGYLLRIRDDNAVLSDEYFIDAATDPIQKRYAQYERAHAAAEQENETPAQVETPVRRDDLTVYLLLPAANGFMLTQLLSTLENYQSHATLLLTPELLEKIRAMGVNIAYVTLHVGLGTFRPVKVDDVQDHVMHSEFYMMDEENAAIINNTRKNGGRVFAVGTTATRTLETIAAEDGSVRACSGWTNIFIYPGYRFKAIDCLVTNFHLPESTLMMLISAFAGRDKIMNAYKIAVEQEYRFFSFGDSMLIYTENAHREDTNV